VGKSRGEFAITEDDIPDGVEWSDKRVAVKEGGRKPMLAIMMRRRGLPKAGEVVVSYRTTGGTAKVGRDYKRLDKSPRWKRDGCTGADSDSKTVKLVIKDDKKKEKTERLFVELHDPKGVIIGPPARLRVAILDND
jgi:hypothetical protein